MQKSFPLSHIASKCIQSHEEGSFLYLYCPLSPFFLHVIPSIKDSTFFRAPDGTWNIDQTRIDEGGWKGGRRTEFIFIFIYIFYFFGPRLMMKVFSSAAQLTVLIIAVSQVLFATTKKDVKMRVVLISRRPKCRRERKERETTDLRSCWFSAMKKWTCCRRRSPMPMTFSSRPPLGGDGTCWNICFEYWPVVTNSGDSLRRMLPSGRADIWSWYQSKVLPDGRQWHISYNSYLDGAILCGRYYLSWKRMTKALSQFDPNNLAVPEENRKDQNK